ncbi:hypothetical protein ACO22_01669 [Paracoccidioides brasiliensis]|uniref:Uncharacterized protein n=1 Tax=Paracoccidioides brasiliensis TaxID=121759 RepID=A0A1D2JL80_PARBR|nr:hypothetical protein ACO22_01669 [Paracoccidioides brasiliensis]
MWISGFGDVPLAILLAHDGTVITMERQTRSELFDSQINSHRAGIGLFVCKGWLLADFEEQSPDALRIFPPLLHHRHSGLGFPIIPSISLVIKCPSSPPWFTDVAIMAI